MPHYCRWLQSRVHRHCGGLWNLWPLCHSAFRSGYDFFRGYPIAVRTDNGPEFISCAFLAWTTLHDIRHILIQPGRPMQNGYSKSFNGKFREECLNEQWFQSLSKARDCIAEWRKDYNEVRPHSSLGRIPPSQFAQQQRIQIFATDSNTINF